MFLVRQSNLVDGEYVLSFVHDEHTYGHYIISQKADFCYSIRNEEPIEGNTNNFNYFVSYTSNYFSFLLCRTLLVISPFDYNVLLLV